MRWGVIYCRRPLDVYSVRTTEDSRLITSRTGLTEGTIYKGDTFFGVDVLEYTQTLPGYRPMLPGETSKSASLVNKDRVVSAGRCINLSLSPSCITRKLVKNNGGVWAVRCDWTTEKKPLVKINPWLFKKQQKPQEGWEEISPIYAATLASRENWNLLGIKCLYLKHQDSILEFLTPSKRTIELAVKDPDLFFFQVPRWVYENGRLPRTNLELRLCGLKRVKEDSDR